MGPILALVGIVATLAVVLWFVARQMALSALHPTLSWDPETVGRGEVLDVKVDVTPVRSIGVHGVEAHLIAHRYAFQSDTQSDLSFVATGETPTGPCEKDTVCHCKVLLCREMVFQPGTPIELVGSIEVPFDVLPSRKDGALQIHWQVSVRFDIVGFPPLVVAKPIDVVRDVYGRKRREREVPRVFAGGEVAVMLEPVVPNRPGPSEPPPRADSRRLEMDPAAPPPVPPPSTGSKFDHLELGD